ncbi:DUF3307 domain-containing protein [Niabella drilacis]|uniref:DUF3307 domain-containing protein n=1 Tax=Niabella drilacis (strain DSM 25811 / CCM 8410 / CCUG 62505 / LMG 26954 / E90) TaxID=1285928 RepID=A0A1G7C0S2_NIADE|nr:DUF3307 domain-containing protein [Niabella drilacis]SDE32869.1 Protein of unknown function [Niabella drilacis]
MMLFIKLLLAHLLGDFVLQPSRWVEEKERNTYKSPKLYLHVLIHFVLILLITMDARYLPLAAFIAGTHLLIDLAKLRFQAPRTRKAFFVLDQVLHLLVLAAAAWWMEPFTLQLSTAQVNALLIITTGLVCLTTPVSVVIKLVLSKWAPATEIRSDIIETRSLQHAGMMIGYLERVLVLIFILNQQWVAIGFLVTAKSVFRFSDLKAGQDRKLTEYILIGTLLSFGIAIVVGVLLQNLLQHKSIAG